MKQGDYVKWIYGPNDERAVPKGIILKKMSDGRIKIVLVVDRKNKLLGTLSDGDIRKGFLKGMDLNSSIETIFNKNQITAKIYEEKKEYLKLATLKKIDQIPIIDDNRKVHDIYVIRELLNPKIRTNKVVLMAGGIGQRLMPLTANTPKPMLKVGNKPIIHTIIKRFKECGFSDFIICLGHKPKFIKDYFGNGKKLSLIHI